MKKSYLVGAFACLAALAPSTTAFAATTEVVTEADVVRQAENTPPTAPWVLYTRAGTPPTAGAFVEGPPAPPLGTGSFQSTTVTGGEKVTLFNYTHTDETLASIDEVAYSTYRTAGTGSQLPALNVQIDTNGSALGGFATLVYEPVYNPSKTVVSNTWQSWTATGSGVWWSTQPINGQCKGATYDCFRTWAEIVANNPGAAIGGVGINQGSGNAGLTGATDAFTFDETKYNFESKPQSKEDCKQGGFAAYTVGNPPRPAFKNQGDCVSSFASGKPKS